MGKYSFNKKTSPVLKFGSLLQLCHLLCMMLQLPDSMKHSQADLYLETYQVLDLEMSRLREIQRWQASAASKVSIPFTSF